VVAVLVIFTRKHPPTQLDQVLILVALGMTRWTQMSERVLNAAPTVLYLLDGAPRRESAGIAALAHPERRTRATSKRNDYVFGDPVNSNDRQLGGKRQTE
jgi:hypothetical protein